MSDTSGRWFAARPAPPPPAARTTTAGVEWLLSADTPGQRVRLLWATQPGAPGVLRCGTVFDVVSLALVPGRALLERLWRSGPGSGPVAVHRDRLLLFAEPGTAGLLPRLLAWEVWDDGGGPPGAETIPRVIGHGLGDTVTVPGPDPAAGAATGCRWLVAPEVRHPWLPDAEALLWAHVRAHRARPSRFRWSGG